jgi:hypothetical protein
VGVQVEGIAVVLAVLGFAIVETSRLDKQRAASPAGQTS